VKEYYSDILANKYKDFLEGIFFRIITLNKKQGLHKIFEKEINKKKKNTRKKLE
jgi:hypothetical protein